MTNQWWVERNREKMCANICLVVSGPDKNNWETIAEVPGHWVRKTKDYDFPNAHLISAAPELLQGAKSVVALLNSFGDDSSKFAATFLTKAIAKAEGKTK